MLRRHVVPAAVCLLGVIVVAVVAIVVSAGWRHDANARVNRSTAAIAASANVERHVIDLETGLRGYLATGDRVFLAPWDAARRILPSEFAQLGRLVEHQPGQERERAALRGAVAAYESGYAVPLLRSPVIAGRPMRLAAVFRRGKALMDALRTRFEAFDTTETRLQGSAQRRAGTLARTFEAITISALVVLLLAMLAVVGYLARVVVAPLRRAIDACVAVAAGSRGVVMPVGGAPEVRELAEAFNAMLEERRAAEADQRLLGLVVSSTQDAIVTTDRDGVITSWNGGAERLYGYAAQEMLGQAMLESGAPAPAVEAARARLERLFAGETISEGAVPRRRKDGTVVVVSLSAAPLLDDAGAVVGVTSIARDVSEEQRLASELADSEERQRLLLGSLPDTLIALYDRSLRCLLLQGPILTQAGIDADAFVGRRIEETLPAEQLAQVLPLIERALEGEAGSVQYSSSLSGLTYAMDVAPYRLADGAIAGAFAVGRDITAHLRGERQLRDQARLLAESQAITHIGSWEWDIGADRLVWSDELCRIAGQPLGFSPTFAEFMALVHPDDRAMVSDGVEEARDGPGGDSEYRIVRPDGEVRFTRGRRFPRTDERGAVTHLFGTTQDVTEQRRIESARERASGQLAEAQRIARIGSWSWDPQTDVATWSEEMYRIFDRDPSLGPATGEALFARIHPEDRDRLAAGYAEAFGGGARFELDYRIATPDGAERVLHGLGSEDPEAPGRYLGTVQDVTELRATERALRAAELQFRQTLELAPIGMALVSLEGRWLEVNRAVCDFVGYDAAELMALTFQDVTHPDDLDADLEFVRSLLAGEIATYRMQKRYLHRSGSVVWAELSVSLVRDDDGAPVHFISQIQDITTQRAAREALQASERRYQGIAANVPGMVFRFAMSPAGEFTLPFVSAGAREIYGVAPEELMADVGLALDGLPEEDRQRFTESVAVSARELSRWEWRGCRASADGPMRYLHGTAQPTREPDGTVLWDGVLLDETEIHLARRHEAETRQRLQLILENLAGSAVVLYDRDLRLRFCEGPLFAHLDTRQLIGRSLSEFVSQEVFAQLAPGVDAALEGQLSSAVLDADREGRTLAIQCAPYRLPDGSIDGALVHWRDISAVRAAERERDEAMELFQVAFERAPIGIVIIGLDGRFQRVNDALCEIAGYSAQELLAMAPFAIVPSDDGDQVQAQFAQLGVVHDSMTFEHRIAHAAGHSVWVQARVTLIRDDHDQPVHVLAQIQDISERRGYEKRLRHMADHDPLTGVFNRRGFETALHTHLAHCRRYAAAGALLMVDLDGFKSVNDALGHGAGDELIIATTHVLTGRLRETDTVARLGGDEFAILLPSQTDAEARIVAQALADAIRENAASACEAPPGRVTASIGVAMCTHASLTAEELFARADLAMYDAKQAGKNRIAFYGQPAPELVPGRAPVSRPAGD